MIDEMNSGFFLYYFIKVNKIIVGNIKLICSVQDTCKLEPLASYSFLLRASTSKSPISSQCTIKVYNDLCKCVYIVTIILSIKVKQLLWFNFFFLGVQCPVNQPIAVFIITLLLSMFIIMVLL